MLNKAIEIATKAHAGQVDKEGNPYIFHPLRVMLTCDDELEQTCAVLHDVVKDTSITLEELAKQGFSDKIIEVLDCLTKRDGESYDAYIDRVLTNQTACSVKLADLCDNMDLTRIKNPTDKDEERIKKYNEAAYKISEALPMADDIENARVISIDGCVEIQPFMTEDDFLHRFIRFVESQGWFFGGGTEDITNKEQSTAQDTLDLAKIINQLSEADKKAIETIVERLIIANDPDCVKLTPKEKIELDAAMQDTETYTLEEVEKGLGL